MEEFERLATAYTAIGRICLVRGKAADGSGWIYEIQIDGLLLMSSVNNVSERRLAESAIERHPGAGLRILVGGLGLGYTAQAALASPRVARVRVVENMDFVIGWMRDGTLPLSSEIGADERLELVCGDVYEQLLGPATLTYDLILVDVDHAPGHLLSPESAPFYTEAGQRRVAAHLKPGGILAVWSAHDCDDFADVLDDVYPSADREDVQWLDQTGTGHAFHNILFFGRR